MNEPKKYEILSHLRQNNREKLTNLSRKTRIPVSTIFENLKNNFSEHILKHTCILDYNKIGFNVKANVLIKFDPKKKKEGIDYISKNIFVNSLSKINNGYDIIAEVICKNVGDLEEFLEKTELNTSIKKKDVFYIMEDVKKEEFFSNPEIVKSLFSTNTQIV